MKMTTRALMGATALCAFAGLSHAETLTIATVNNGDMIRMQALASDFTEKNRDRTGMGDAGRKRASPACHH